MSSRLSELCEKRRIVLRERTNGRGNGNERTCGKLGYNLDMGGFFSGVLWAGLSIRIP